MYSTLSDLKQNLQAQWKIPSKNIATRACFQSAKVLAQSFIHKQDFVQHVASVPYHD